jgi:hypothetical protein
VAFNLPPFNPADYTPIAANQFGPLHYKTNWLHNLSSLTRQVNSVGNNPPGEELEEEQ